jgi:hypothetical protein
LLNPLCNTSPITVDQFFKLKPRRQLTGCTHFGGDVAHSLPPYPILEKSLQSDPPHLLHPVLVLLDVPALTLPLVFGGRAEDFVLDGGGVGGSLLLGGGFLERRRDMSLSVFSGDIGLGLRAWATKGQRCNLA